MTLWCRHQARTNLPLIINLRRWSMQQIFHFRWWITLSLPSWCLYFDQDTDCQHAMMWGDNFLIKSTPLCSSHCKDQLWGETVSMAVDECSKVHNELIVCVSVTSETGQSFITATVDTSGYSHTSEYLQDVASKAVRATRAVCLQGGQLCERQCSPHAEDEEQLGWWQWVWHCVVRMFGTLLELVAKYVSVWSERTHCSSHQVLQKWPPACSMVSGCWCCPSMFAGTHFQIVWFISECSEASKSSVY